MAGRNWPTDAFLAAQLGQLAMTARYMQYMLQPHHEPTDEEFTLDGIAAWSDAMWAMAAAENGELLEEMPPWPPQHLYAAADDDDGIAADPDAAPSGLAPPADSHEHHDTEDAHIQCNRLGTDSHSFLFL